MSDTNALPSIQRNGMMLEVNDTRQIEDLIVELYCGLSKVHRVEVLRQLKQIAQEDLIDRGV